MNDIEYQLDKYILVVEDNEYNELYLCTILKRFGIVNILKAVNGDECIKLFKKYKQDIFLVFMDLRLSSDSGYDIIQKLLKIKKVNIVIQSALTFIEDKNKASDLGCVDYIIKPFTQEQIKKILDKYYSK